MTRPERVQAAFEVWRERPETGPNATALFEYIEQLEAALASISEPARAEEGKEPVAWLDDIGNFWLTEEAGKSHNARPLYAAPSSSTLEITEEAVEAAMAAGWNACRKSIYAVCEDVAAEADRIRITAAVGSAAEEQHAKGYHAGTCRAAKSIARGFNSMEARDDDNFRAALEASLPFLSQTGGEKS